MPSRGEAAESRARTHLVLGAAKHDGIAQQQVELCQAVGALEHLPLRGVACREGGASVARVSGSGVGCA